MKIGGQIPWSAILICEKFKISCLMGRLHTNDVLENLFKDQSFRLVHWWSITLSLRKTSQESINLERKSYLDCFLDTLCTRVVADVEELETMDASEIYSKKSQCKGSNISQTKWKIHFSSRRRTNEIRWRRSGTENIHFDTGTTQFEEKIKEIFLENLKGLHLDIFKIHIRMPVKQEKILVHFRKLLIPPSRFIPESNFTRRQKKSFPIPLKYIDASRTTRTNLDVMQERRIDD